MLLLCWNWNWIITKEVFESCSVHFRLIWEVSILVAGYIFVSPVLLVLMFVVIYFHLLDVSEIMACLNDAFSD